MTSESTHQDHCPPNRAGGPRHSAEASMLTQRRRCETRSRQCTRKQCRAGTLTVGSKNLPILLLMLFLAACSGDNPRETRPATVNGVTDTEILIGSSLALGGHAGYLGTQTLHGARSYLNYVNELGGVHGRKIRLIAYDDEYDPPKCVYYTQRLVVKDKVFALFCYVGTPTTVKVIPMIQEARIPLVGMFTGAHALREPFHRYLINVRASYYQETAAAIKMMIKEFKFDRIAVFYQYDAYGFDGLEGTELALKSYNLVPVGTGTYIRGTLDVEAGLAKIIQANAQAVVMIGTYDPCAKFIRLARSAGYNPLFYNVSFVGADELARKLGPYGNGVVVSQVVPPPELPETRQHLIGAKEYARHLKQYYPTDKPNFVGLEGYLNAMVLTEGLRRAGKALDREGFVDAIDSITDFDLGIANTLSFGPTDHQGLDHVYFTRIEQDKFVLMDRQGGVRP
jgi:branched-chain amino acid transport system substrate-binding protein